MRAILLTLTTCLLVVPAYAKYSGGTGEPNDPYQIATAADLIALGQDPNDYDKQFILTDDIDLAGHVFDKAVIAPDWERSFTGVFDGNGRTMSHLTIMGMHDLGLFGGLASGAEVKDLGVVDVNMIGSGDYVGGLVGYNERSNVTQCYIAGTISGDSYVGAIVGQNYGGTLTNCHTSGAVSGNWEVGGLVGSNYDGTVAQCYSTATVSGGDDVGGLVGENYGDVTYCYSTGMVNGNDGVGGLVGDGWAGGVSHCFWDIQMSSQGRSAGGLGLTTAQMQTKATFSCWPGDGVWTIDEGKDYPRLWWENAPGEPISRTYYYGGGSGSETDPYMIYTAEQLYMIGLIACDWDKNFKLMADIDVSGFDGKEGRLAFNAIGPAWVESLAPPYLSFGGTPFTGVFNGNGHRISHLTLMVDGRCGGLFGGLASEAVVRNLGVVDVNITGSGDGVGAMVGFSDNGNVTHCYSTGTVSGNEYVGGLMGFNYGGDLTECCTTAVVSGTGDCIGGLVGSNGFQGKWHRVSGAITHCYSNGTVSGTRYGVGGLVGENGGTLTECYSTGTVSGNDGVGGLVGINGNGGTVTECHSSGAVDGNDNVGGLVGRCDASNVVASFWDTQTSGQATSAVGTGKTTVEMQTAKTFLDAGWDFVGETDNGTDDIWKIAEGLGYPRLSWEKYSGGTGEANDPYQIATAADLIALDETPADYDKHFVLTADIDLDPNLPGRKVFDKAVIAPDTNLAKESFQGTPFTGVFDGNGHTVSHLTISGWDYLGLFGWLNWQAGVKNLGVVDVDITGSGSSIGGLVGCNECRVTQCYSTGIVSGGWFIGGLVGGSDCYDAAVTQCYSTAAVSGQSYVGGLVGYDEYGTVTQCYSTGAVRGTGQSVGGLVGGDDYGTVTACFWDAQTSGQAKSAGGTGKTTAEMQTAKTFLDAGWDFVGETANGTEDIWWILEGKDYPRLWWEATNN